MSMPSTSFTNRRESTVWSNQLPIDPTGRPSTNVEQSSLVKATQGKLSLPVVTMFARASNGTPRLKPGHTPDLENSR